MKKLLQLLSILCFSQFQSFAQCPETITVNQESGCGLYTLHLNSFGDLGNIIWTLDESEQLGSGMNDILWGAYGPGMHFICAQAWTGDCPDGTTVCIDIEVPMCPAWTCPTFIEASATQNCHLFNFEIGSFSEGEAVSWYFDNIGPIEGGHAISHEFETDGAHIICAYYTSTEFCIEGTELCTTIEVSCSCPTEIWSGPGVGCGAMNFEIGSFVEGENVIWYPGDETGQVVGGHFLEHIYDLPGEYQVCAFYTSPICPDGVELCETIVVESCNSSNCPSNIVAEQIDCDSYIFHIEGVDTGNVVWDFGDGTSETSGIAADHTYDANGLNIVTANYFGPNCQEGVVILYTIIVQCNIESNCPNAISSGPGEACGVMNFEIGSFVEGENVTWYPGDESGAVTGGHFFTHTYETPGEYQVCAFYTSPLCPDGVELCTIIVVEPCNSTGCPSYIIAEQIDCDTYVFHIDGAETGEVFWNFGNNNSIGSGVVVDHTFNSNGPQIVTAVYFGPNCLEGITLILTVLVNCENQTECPTEIWSGAGNDCGVMNFEIGSFVEGENVTWFPGDESGAVIGGHFFTHTYETPGEYQVCAFYTSPACPDGVELCTVINVANCGEENCPTAITITPMNCHQYLFSVNEWGNSLYGDILWSFGDNDGYGQNEFLHMYLEPGMQEVCVSGTTDACPNGFELCTSLYVEACGGDSNEDGCPDWIWGYPVNDCGLWHFEAGQFEVAEETVIWNWGDGSTSDGNTIANHQYLEDGLYIVTLTYTSLNCNETIQIYYTLEANACELPPCPQEIWSAAGEDCGVMNFEAGSFVEGEAFVWSFGDNTTAEGGHFISHQYAEPGTYIVCFFMSNSICEAWQLCTEITVEPCDVECTELTVGIDSYVNDGGTPALVYSIMNYDTNEIIGFEEVTYNSQDPYYDGMYCLPDGCYTLTVDNNNAIVLGQGVNVFLTVNGQNIMENAQILYQDNVSFVILFGINSDCSGNETCESAFEPIFTNTAGHLEFINNSTSEGITTYAWDYGDGQTSDGESGNVWYTSNGVYPVCLTITTDNCEDTYCTVVSVQNMETECAENLVLISLVAEYSENTNDLIQIALALDGFEINDWVLPTNTGFTSTIELCIPDGCYELDLSTEIPLSASAINATISYDGNTIDVLEFLNNTTSESVMFAINSICEDAISESELIDYLIYPNPANSQIQFQTNNNERITSISVYDATGRMVSSFNPKDKVAVMDVSSFSSGIYTARITSGTQVNMKRIEIIH